MDLSFLVLFGSVVLVGVVLYVLISNKIASLNGSGKQSEELMAVIRMLQNGSQEDRKTLLHSLQSNTQALNERLDATARVIGDVQKNIGEMSEIGRSMKDLQEFLKSPKLRGNIGEHVLKELLSQLLPKNSFFLQYTFRSGEKVDAAIKTTAGIIPIDSKFPMENFRRMIDGDDGQRKSAQKAFEVDVKKHIDSIAKKYILTSEGTTDYALMYIPSESVYYEIVNNSVLFDHATHKRILPVSPTIFYAYMRAILMSFEGQKIGAQAQEILASIRAVQKDYSKVEDTLSILQKHISNASNTMSSLFQTFSQLGQKITSIHQIEEKDEIKKLNPS